jgi:hypothetical protein
VSRAWLALAAAAAGCAGELSTFTGDAGTIVQQPPAPDAGPTQPQSPLAVAGTSPSAEATGVDISQTIQIRFNEAVDPATVSSNSLPVVSGAAAVAGSYAVVGGTVTFTPISDLLPHTIYVAEATEAVRDLQGNALTQNFLLRFTTNTPLDFTMTQAPGSFAAVQGGSAGTELTFIVTAGQPEPVALTLDGCPSDAQCRLATDQALVNGMMATPFLGAPEFIDTISLTIVTSVSTLPGIYPLTLHGSAHHVAHDLELSLSIVAPPDEGTPRLVWGDAAMGVTVLPGTKRLFAASTDGAGGVLAAWSDERPNGHQGYYAQRFDRAGRALWGDQGLLMVADATVSAVFDAPMLLPDGTAGGGFLILPSFDLAALRFAPDGSPVWPAGPVALTTCGGIRACQQKSDLTLLPDGAGGFIAVWNELMDFSVWAQRVSASGQILWAPGGQRVSPSDQTALAPRPIPDGAGGVIVVWDLFPNGSGLVMQHLDASGATLLAPDGFALGGAIGGLQIASDGAGGALMVAGTATDIHIARTTGAGALIWETAALTNTLLDESPSVALVADGAGGAIVTWLDSRADPASGSNFGAYAQRVDATGAAGWSAGGVLVEGQQTLLPGLIADGHGGAFFVPQRGVAVQRIDGAGTTRWSQSPYTGADTGFNGVPIADGEGGAFVVFLDSRMPSPYGAIYAAYIRSEL